MNEKRFENRLNKDIKKFNALNPVWDNEKEDALNVFEMIEIMNDLNNTVERLTVFKNLIGKKYSLSEPHRAYLLNNNKPLFHWINDDDKIIDLLNEYDYYFNIAMTEKQELNNRLNKYIMDYNGLNCEYHELKEENEHLRELLDIGETDAVSILEKLNEQQSKIKQLEKEITYHQKKHHTAFMDGRDMGIREVEDALEKIKRYE